MNVYQNKIASIRSEFDRRCGHLESLQKELSSLEDQLIKQEYQQKLDFMSREVLEALSKTSEAQVKAYIEPIVTEALQTVFGYDLKFELEFDFKSNQVIVRFKLTDSHGNASEGNIEDMKGGGVLDVISIVLRFILLELLNLPGIILLDEPGKFVDIKHQGAFGTLLLSFAEKFDRQLCIVSHDEGICAIGTKHYNVSLNAKGESELTLIEQS